MAADVDLTFRGSAPLESLKGPVQLRSARSRYAGYQWDALNRRIDVAGRRLRLAADLRAYGASGSATGTIDIRDAVSYALEGRLQGVNLRRLPPRFRLPPLQGRLAGRYTARGAGSRVTAVMHFDQSTVEGVAIAAGSEGRLDLRTPTPAYGFTGAVASLDVARIGRALGIEAISDGRFASQLTGRLEVDGSGNSFSGLRLHANAGLEPSSLHGMSLAGAALDVTIADEMLGGTVKADQFVAQRVGHGPRAECCRPRAGPVRSARSGPARRPADVRRLPVAGRRIRRDRCRVRTCRIACRRAAAGWQ